MLFTCLTWNAGTSRSHFYCHHPHHPSPCMVSCCLYCLISPLSYLSLNLSYLLSYPLLVPLLLPLLLHHLFPLLHLKEKIIENSSLIIFSILMYISYFICMYISVIHHNFYYPPISGTGTHLFLGFRTLTVMQSCPL